MFSLEPRCQGLCGFAEVDGDVGRQGEALMVSELLASIPGERLVQFAGYFLACLMSASGSANSYIVTLVERQTRYLMLAKNPQPRHADCRLGTHQAGQEATRRTVQVAHLGSRQGAH